MIQCNTDTSAGFISLSRVFGLKYKIKCAGLKRLINEMKCFVLTSQVTNFFIEIILPYLLQAEAVLVKRIQRIIVKDDIRNEDESVFLKKLKKSETAYLYHPTSNTFSLASLIVKIIL